MKAGGNKDFALGGRIVSGLGARGDVVFFGPTYVFETPVLGGQAALSMLGVAGRPNVAISATLTGPRGNTLSGTRTDLRGGFGDLYPQASLKWNEGVHNFMTYATGDIPVGAYDTSRLANLGIGHGAADAGGGYTYFDPLKGHELSAVAGFTCNFINPSTDYRSGIDFHLD